MVKNPFASSGDLRDMGSNPGSGRFPGGGQPTPVFLLGESHGPRGLLGHSPWGHRESGVTEETKRSTHSTGVCRCVGRAREGFR